MRPSTNTTTTAGRLAAAFVELRRFFGLSRWTPEQQITYQELMSLSDRDLADIGLTRGMIETVVLQGTESVRALSPESAIHPANANPLAGAA
jgi:uncharacterized protein YjiS (DUF1127 family)